MVYLKFRDLFGMIFIVQMLSKPVYTPDASIHLHKQVWWTGELLAQGTQVSDCFAYY